MGPIDKTDKYDFIWSEVDNKYIAFPRFHKESVFEYKEIWGASTLNMIIL